MGPRRNGAGNRQILHHQPQPVGRVGGKDTPRQRRQRTGRGCKPRGSPKSPRTTRGGDSQVGRSTETAQGTASKHRGDHRHPGHDPQWRDWQARHSPRGRAGHHQRHPKDP
ncbi:MAG: hypothetical protein OXF06_00150 [Bacteroidetes bacterium]|nr:hypothetical protein [Bacteroidota bacterium]